LNRSRIFLASADLSIDRLDLAGTSISDTRRSGRNFLQEHAMKSALIVAAVFSVLLLTDISAQQWGSGQIGNLNVSGPAELPYLVSMGPDPGGHTGATVTPETSKSGQPAVDSARTTASGGKTESSGPPVSEAPQARKQ
jgi:hypothetical protein